MNAEVLRSVLSSSTPKGRFDKITLSVASLHTLSRRHRSDASNNL